MLPRPTDSPLELPEVLLLVAIFLDRGDCARCTLVCKLWYRSFLSGVWGRAMTLGRGAPDPTPQSLQSHVHLVHDIDMFLHAGIQQYHGFVFPSLKSLAILVHLNYSQNAAALVLAHPTVVYLTQNMDRHQLLLWDSIARFPHLKALHFKWITIHPETVESFWIACARLEELILYFVSISRDADLLGTLTFPMMKRLIWKGLEELSNTELLQSCPNIQKLSWRTFETPNSSGLQEFKRLVCAGTWPNLKSLELPRSLDDDYLAIVLGGLNKITDLKLCGMFGPKSFAILRRHVTTIESLDFEGCDPDMLTSEMLEEIRSTCPLLKQMVHPWK